MKPFTSSISKIFKGAMEAFKTFPMTIGCALAFAIVTIIRIHLDWAEQEDYNFLFNCLHLSLALGAIFSLAAITAAKSRADTAKAFMIANFLGIGVVIVTFLMLIFFGGTASTLDSMRGEMVSGIAATRVAVAILISFIAFIILASYPKEQSDFSQSFFMTHKAFFIAWIYGGVIMAGTTGVARAVQALLYNDMSEKVYQYIATLVVFLAFTIFVGYFPKFNKGQVDEKREIAQKQPRFIEILFSYILIPIMLALTVVLLLWAGRTMLSGLESTFIQLSSIATAYATGGIWLYIMVTHQEFGLSKLYKRIYPFTLLVILAFEAWALWVQLDKFGMKTTEYSFILIWIIAFVSAILFILIKSKAYQTIALTVCGVAFFSVLPFLGYHALPVTSQINRLENELTRQGMLVNDQIIPATSEPELSVRESISDAVSYLAYAEDAKLPVWFDKNLNEEINFKNKFGFSQVWPKVEIYGSENYTGTYLGPASGAIDISDYRWVVKLQAFEEKQNPTVTLEGDNGTYQLSWSTNQKEGIPTLKIDLDNQTIVEEDMNEFIDKILESYPPGRSGFSVAKLEEMTLKLETPEVSILLVFNNIEINSDNQRDVMNYWINLSELYLKEKP